MGVLRKRIGQGALLILGLLANPMSGFGGEPLWSSSHGSDWVATPPKSGAATIPIPAVSHSSSGVDGKSETGTGKTPWGSMAQGGTASGSTPPTRWPSGNRYEGGSGWSPAPEPPSRPRSEWGDERGRRDPWEERDYAPPGRDRGGRYVPPPPGQDGNAGYGAPMEPGYGPEYGYPDPSSQPRRAPPRGWNRSGVPLEEEGYPDMPMDSAPRGYGGRPEPGYLPPERWGGERERYPERGYDGYPPSSRSGPSPAYAPQRYDAPEYGRPPAPYAEPGMDAREGPRGYGPPRWGESPYPGYEQGMPRPYGDRNRGGFRGYDEGALPEEQGGWPPMEESLPDTEPHTGFPSWGRPPSPYGMPGQGWGSPPQGAPIQPGMTPMNGGAPNGGQTLRGPTDRVEEVQPLEKKKEASKLRKQDEGEKPVRTEGKNKQERERMASPKEANQAEIDRTPTHPPGENSPTEARSTGEQGKK